MFDGNLPLTVFFTCLSDWVSKRATLHGSSCQWTRIISQSSSNPSVPRIASTWSTSAWTPACPTPIPCASTGKSRACSAYMLFSWLAVTIQSSNGFLFFLCRYKLQFLRNIGFTVTTPLCDWLSVNVAITT